MKLIPLADRVVVKLVEAEEKTKTGIILTAAAQEKPQVAQVIAVGPGGVVDGKASKDVRVITSVKRGLSPYEDFEGYLALAHNKDMRFIISNITSKYAGTEVKCNGTEYNIVRQNDILAIVED